MTNNNKHYTVKTKDEAFEIAAKYMPFDYELDDVSKAVYPVYRTVRHMWDQPSGDWAYYCYICDLGNTLEVNIVNEKWEPTTVYIDIKSADDESDDKSENKPEYAEYMIADLLESIDDILYIIDDKILPSVFDDMIGKDVRDRIYAGYGSAYKYLKRAYPESKLIDEYNLKYSIPAEPAEPEPESNPGVMFEYQLTVGLFDKDTETQKITETAAREIIGDILINQFELFAFTMIPAAGVYKMNSTGRIVNEPSIRIEIATDTEIKIDEITEELKRRLNQESIMVKKSIEHINFY